MTRHPSHRVSSLRHLALTYSAGNLPWCKTAFLGMGGSQHPRQDLWGGKKGKK